MCFWMSTRNRARYYILLPKRVFIESAVKSEMCYCNMSWQKWSSTSRLRLHSLGENYKEVTEIKTDLCKQTIAIRVVAYNQHFIRYADTHSNSTTPTISLRMFTNLVCHDTAEYPTPLLQNFLHNNQGQANVWGAQRHNSTLLSHTTIWWW
jgi:hypothetical protein